MKWVRSNIKHGSRLALFALAIQFVVSFGHFHGTVAQAAPAIGTGVTQFTPSQAERLPARNVIARNSATKPVQQQPGSNQEPDRDICAICAVMALANAMLFASPPPTPLPQAVEFAYLATHAGFVHLSPTRVAFQSRAPPAS